MSISNYLLIGISLAMDAFAVCVCQGMAVTENKGKLGIKLGITFGCFQGLMPLLGYKIGNIFSDKISVYGNIIACIILVGIGINMIREAKNEEECSVISDLKTLIILGIATSIDAFIVGLSFAFNGANYIYCGILIIAIVTFIICFIGTTIGVQIKDRIGKKAQYFGALVLIVLGIKALISSI